MFPGKALIVLLLQTELRQGIPLLQIPINGLSGSADLRRAPAPASRNLENSLSTGYK
jgi:hypothetical protein